MAKTVIRNTADRIVSELGIARTRGRTCQEIVKRYDLVRGTVSTYLSKLVESGDIVTDGTRQNTNGVSVTVYKLPQYTTV